MRTRRASRPETRLVMLLIATFGSGQAAHAQVAASGLSGTAAERVLVEALQQKGEWTSVHAAEYLLLAGRPQPVRDAFRPQADETTPAYRIGVWRVLAQAAPAAERSPYVEQIRAAFLDATSPDRLHALESLAKLQVPPASEAERTLVRQLADDDHYPGQAFALWRLEQQPPREARSDRLTRLVAALQSDEAVLRLRAAFVLAQLNSLPPEVHAALKSALASESRGSIAYPYLAIAVGGQPLEKLALAADHPTDQALAVRELVLRGKTVPAIKLSTESPLALKMAVAFARLQASKDETTGS